MKNRKRPKGMSAKRRERAAKALQYRKEGRSYRLIADTLGISLATAYEDVQMAMREITREPAEELLELELARLDDAYLRLNAELGRIAKAAKEGEVDAGKASNTAIRVIEAQLKVQDRRARYLGLDQLPASDTGDIRATVREALLAALGED